MSMVTIVMTTYNGEKYAGEQIESILSSTFQDFLLMIYDDGSTDTTMDILKSYADRYPDKIHVYRNKKNLGVTMNFLNAVCRTTTEYIMFCDQDDVWMPDKISVTLSRMRYMEGQLGKAIPVAVFTDAIVTDVELNVVHESFFRSGRLDPKKTDLSHLLMENKLIGCTLMINSALRRILQSHRMPKYARFHDWWIALIAASAGKICYIAQPTMYYRQHEKNIVGNQSFGSYVRNRLLSLRKQKKALLALMRQADELCAIYEDVLTDEKQALIRRFAELHQVNPIKRRYYILRFGYLKTGLIRNAGLMLIV